MVILYSKGNCARCMIVKDALADKKIPYQLEDKNFEKILSKGYRGVPVLEVDGKFMAFDDALTYIEGR